MIPDAAFDQHTGYLGKTGAGKSYALRGAVEKLLSQGKRVCVVDPKGDWWGLKSSADGKRPGYPVVIFGGEHADVPINPHCGAQVAEIVATGNRPCVIDFGGWMVGDRTRFWIDFSSTLFRLNKSPLWLVIDEVHNFAPQGKIYDPDAGKCLHWTNRIASEGRGKGFRLMIASQRPQKVHKDTLTCVETLIAMRVLHPLDRAPIKEWLEGAGDKGTASHVLDELSALQRGEALIDQTLNGLGKCEAAILEAVIGAYPEGLFGNKIAEVTGYSESSGSFKNALSKLRTLEYIDRGQPIRASATFFIR